MTSNLRQFLEILKSQNALVIVDTEVDADLEIAEIHRRVIAAGGPALLFTKVKNSSFPVVTNLFGTKQRVDLAFGNRPKKFVEAIAKLPEDLFPPKLDRLWQLRSVFFQGLKIGLHKTGNAPVLQCRMHPIDLSRLPALKSWQEDGGRFFTLPLVHTLQIAKKPDNLGIYRMQIFNQFETGMHFQIGKGGGFHLFEAEQKSIPLPVNVYLGGPPALLLAAIAPLPENIPELLLASLILGKKLKRGPVLANGVPPVAEAEFCLSGYVQNHLRRPEGPFGDHYGYYSLIHDYPVFRVSEIYHRKDAIFPATVVGKPRQEDFYLGNYLQELLRPLITLTIPNIKDLWSYGETGFHSLAAGVVRERYSRECMSAAFRILGEGQLSLTKCLMLVDGSLNLQNFSELLTYVLERIDWRKDLFVFSELSMDSLDYTGPKINHGSKAVFLGIGTPIRSLPRELRSIEDHAFIKNIKPYLPGCLVVEVPSYKENKTCVETILAMKGLQDWPLIIAVDNLQKTLNSQTSFLWTTFTRFNPGTDIHAKSKTINSNHIAYDGPILIDARIKPHYPKELFCDPETAKRVSERWREYFPKQKVEMGDSDMAHL